jgi:hypothetical protein
MSFRIRELMRTDPDARARTGGCPPRWTLALASNDFCTGAQTGVFGRLSDRHPGEIRHQVPTSVSGSHRECRSCKRGRYAPPVHLIKLTATQRSRRSRGCIRMDAGPRRPACPRARPRRRQSGSAVRRHSGRGRSRRCGTCSLRSATPARSARPIAAGSERCETAPIRPSNSPKTGELRIGHTRSGATGI